IPRVARVGRNPHPVPRQHQPQAQCPRAVGVDVPHRSTGLAPDREPLSPRARGRSGTRGNRQPRPGDGVAGPEMDSEFIHPRRLVGIAVCLAFGVSFGADEAPPSAFKPWSPPDLGKYEKELVESNGRRTTGNEGIAIDPEKTYELPELIDIAERAN